MTDEQAAEMVATLNRIEELLITFARTQAAMAGTLRILANSLQHGRSRG